MTIQQPSYLPTRRRRRPSLTAGKLDPRRVGVSLDAMALDRNGSDRDRLVARLEALMEADEINVRQSGVAYRQMLHAPHQVRAVVEGQVFTLPTNLTSEEERGLAQVRAVMRGNAITNKHDADAYIVFDAKKYGGYLVTEDKRILRRRAELEAIPAPASVWIVSLVEFLAIYDQFAASAESMIQR